MTGASKGMFTFRREFANHELPPSPQGPDRTEVRGLKHSVESPEVDHLGGTAERSHEFLGRIAGLAT